jgi:RNA polymerase sigma-70 factor, ECF subfamily
MSRCDSLTFIPERGGYAGWDELDPLMAAVARGDPGAFDLVYERLSGPVYGVILAVLRDRAQAEEVAQEVFLEMWRLAFRYDPAKGSATRWALTIARHRAIDRVRSAAASSARDLRNANAPPPAQASDTAAGAADPELLRQCLASLSDLQREAIMLTFYGEHTYAEAAGLLGIPLPTIKARIRGGLARLRSCMQSGAGAREQETAARQLHDTLDSRVLIEQAKGILAERLHMTPDEAFVLLRRHARDHDLPLAQLAGDIARRTAATVRGGPPAASPASRGEQSADPAAARLTTLAFPPGSAARRPPDGER